MKINITIKFAVQLISAIFSMVSRIFIFDFDRFFSILTKKLWK